MFIFTVCQQGAESAVKKEIAQGYANLNFAYSRPGFITFKNRDEGKAIAPDFELKSIFARAYGLSIGKAGAPSEAFAAAENLLREIGQPSGKLRLHVWERDSYASGEEPKDYVLGRASSEALSELKKSPRFTELFFADEKAEVGDFV